MPALKYKTKAQSLDDGRECVLSDGTIDAYGDICESSPGSWLTDRFKKNPLALLNHSSNFPIGTWKNVRVENGALRGTLHLAPVGTSPRHDEVRALIDAKILVGLSVGFVPIESVPIPGGNGMRYTKMELMECSVVSIPANENALMKCRSLGISNETQRLLFKQKPDLTLGQRIRDYRQSIRKLKDRIARETNPKTRASMMRALKHLENAEREMSASLSPKPIARSDEDEFMAQCISDLEDQGIDDAEDVCQILWEERAHKEQSRAKALALIKRIDERLAREYAASPAGQARRHQQETIEAFNRTAQRRPQDPPPFKPSGDGYGTWRDWKNPGPIWQGKKVK